MQAERFRLIEGKAGGQAPEVNERNPRRARLAGGRGERVVDSFVERTHREVYTLAALLTGDEAIAHAVTTNTYLRLPERLRSAPKDADMSTLLHRVTARCASEQLGIRRNGEATEISPDIDDPAQLPSVPNDTAPIVEAYDDSLTGTREAVAALPPDQRVAVILRDTYNLPSDVIADELGISSAALTRNLSRGRQTLKEWLYPSP